MKTEEEVMLYIQAGCRLLGLETRDDAAAKAVLAPALEGYGTRVGHYNPAMEVRDDTGFDCDPTAPLARFLRNLPEAVEAVVLRDVGAALGRPEVVAQIKNMVTPDDGQKPRLVFVVGRTVSFAPELAVLAHVLQVAPPARAEVADQVDGFARAHGISPADMERDAVVDALRGVPGCMLPRLLGVVWARHGAVRAADVRAEKISELRGHSLLEPVALPPDACDAGGLLNLRGYLEHVSHLLARPEAARRFGVDVPKGVLVAGMPGCGKSLAAKMAARLFGLPLLRLDTGRLMGRYNGDSEHNLREALADAEAQAPCVLWIDEVEKAFAGVGRDSDNGVATRLFGSFLTWLNERSLPVYTIATANDIRGLPPELMRRGRFDELFFVDFPTADEARTILERQLARRGRSLPADDVDELARAAASRGFSGADLEGVVKVGLEFAFERMLGEQTADGTGPRAVDGTADDFRTAMAMANSTYESMKPKVDDLRARLKEFRLTPASASHAKGGVR